MSESIEMYLLRVALLQENEQPVPIPLLAQELSISPVSAHEMCRKLTDKGLIHYEPYKGVTLTEQGDALARRVLRRRHLWEVFFVDKLGFGPEEADEIACRFEHVTPDELADQLATFLESPESSRNITLPEDKATKRPTRPLASFTAGQRGRVIDITLDDVAKEFLHHQGIFPGGVIDVLAVAADGSLLLDVGSQHLSLSPTLAGGVEVILVTESFSEDPAPFSEAPASEKA
ncbi:DtxR family transcriptional regulator [Chloroflexota bacterium]